MPFINNNFIILNKNHHYLTLFFNITLLDKKDYTRIENQKSIKYQLITSQLPHFYNNDIIKKIIL